MSDVPSINQDIKKTNVSLEEGDKGFLLSFPAPPPGSVKPRDLYSFNFDSPVGGRLPQNPRTDIVFTPSKLNNKEEASFLNSSVNTNINIGLAIKSKHRAETQTLIRLQIKDIYNEVLYTDYILVISSPIKVVKLNAELIATIVMGSIGPNGGRILQINTTDSSQNLVSSLFTRMRVTGPGIPQEQTVTIGSFVNEDRLRIELLPFFETDRDTDINNFYTGTYSFANIFSCPSQEDLLSIQLNASFIILNKDNNWSYFFRQKPVIQFIPNKDLLNDWENISILLNVKNFEALVSEGQASQLPVVSFIRAVGRVNNDSVCINSV